MEKCGINYSLMFVAEFEYENDNDCDMEKLFRREAGGRMEGKVFANSYLLLVTRKIP
jgi:hypothetical protein